MEEMITLCGDNYLVCPRYNAHSKEYQLLEKAFFEKKSNLEK